MALKDKYESLVKKASSIKKKVFDWLDKPRWKNRLFLYSVLAVVVIAISHYIFSYFGFLHTDIDSARYMLSALVQGEAAIVALVVTLSLVAVQLAAQSYSARVIEVFRKAPDLWILMGIYGIAIFYGLGVLKLINKDNISDLEIYISFAYYFGIFAFVALVPYMLKMFEMLKPSTVINMLAERITNEKILNYITEGQEKPNDKDPIQPIVDIVYSSLMRYDYVAMREGLKVIYKKAFEILNDDSSNNKNADCERIFNHILLHLVRVERVMVNNNDEISLKELVINIGKIGETAVNKKSTTVATLIIRHLTMVGEDSIKHNLKEVPIITINSMGNMGIEAAKQEKEQITINVVTMIGLFGPKITYDNFNGTELALNILEKIRKVAEENKRVLTLKMIENYRN